MSNLVGTAASPPRSLIKDMLLIQLVFAAAVGLIALASVWGISKGVVRDNAERWSSRWMAELTSLGAGLFLRDDATTVIALRGYLDRYDELLYIRYYDHAGQPVYVESRLQDLPFPPLGSGHLKTWKRWHSPMDLPGMMSDRVLSSGWDRRSLPSRSLARPTSTPPNRSMI